jgi:Cu/Ag efflux protein CusF
VIVKPFFSLCVPLILALILIGCRSGSDAPKEKTYEVKGTVVAVDANKPSIKLDHQDIPGLMKAMVMDFDVANPKILDGVKPGDKVAGKLKVDADNQTITALDKLP